MAFAAAQHRHGARNREVETRRIQTYLARNGLQQRISIVFRLAHEMRSSTFPTVSAGIVSGVEWGMFRRWMFEIEREEMVKRSIIGECCAWNSRPFYLLACGVSYSRAPSWMPLQPLSADLTRSCLAEASRFASYSRVLFGSCSHCVIIEIPLLTIGLHGCSAGIWRHGWAGGCGSHYYFRMADTTIVTCVNGR
jgi:hypothetical protein